MNKMSNVDFYTKVLLFVIAVALWGLLLKPFVPDVELSKSVEAAITPELLEEIRESNRRRVEAQEAEAKANTTKVNKELVRALEETYGLKGTDLIIRLLGAIRSDVSSIKSRLY